MFEHSDFDHERIIHICDRASGLKAIIAIHTMAMGPAAGGVRLWDYADSNAALLDVLRLSQGMSYKNAMAGLPFGGGKAVILGPVAPENRTKILLAFGEAVEGLAGDYITAEDAGIGSKDMEMVALRTRYVKGLSPNGVVGGEQAPYTARGVIEGMRAAIKFKLGRDDFDGLKVAVKGIGHVGLELCKRLKGLGAHVFVSDINPKNVADAVSLYDCVAVKNDDLHKQAVDVFAPCALGASITPDVARQLKAQIVAGSANNQLSSPEAGTIMAERGILYAPDYVINAGAIIMISAIYSGITDMTKVETLIDRIGPRLTDIFAQASAENLSPEAISDKMAVERIAKARRPLKGVAPSVLFA